MIVAILLAAGKSSRTGNQNKLLLKYKKTKVITSSIRNILDSKVDKIIVVIGKNKQLIKKHIPKQKKIKIIFLLLWQICQKYQLHIIIK
jgi:CTP:molybdopterin cytidylyltransferase MocA